MPKQYGYGLNNIEKTGYTWMLLYWKIKVINRPRWNSELTVKTWPRAFEKVSSWRDFEVYDQAGNLVVIATTQWVLIDVRSQKVSRITETMQEEYGIEPKSVFEEELTGRLKPEENAKKITEYTAVKRDIDANHHVNNANYLDIAYDILPEDLSTNFENLEIYYKKQIKLRRNSRNILHKRRKYTYSRNKKPRRKKLTRNIKILLNWPSVILTWNKNRYIVEL